MTSLKKPIKKTNTRNTHNQNHKYLNRYNIPGNPDKHGGNNNCINFGNLNNDLINKTLISTMNDFIKYVYILINYSLK